MTVMRFIDNLPDAIVPPAPRTRFVAYLGRWEPYEACNHRARLLPAGYRRGLRLVNKSLTVTSENIGCLGGAHPGPMAFI